MTFRQKEALDFIRGFWQMYGFAPSYDEIGSALELKSKSGCIGWCVVWWRGVGL